MKKIFSTLWGVTVHPRKLFGQLPPASSYWRSDLYLCVVFSPLLVLGVWGFSMLAGVQRHGHLVQSSVITLFVVAIIFVIAMTGRIWALSLKWASRQFASVEVKMRDLYQIFAYALTPLLLKVLILLLSFLVMLIGMVLPSSILMPFFPVFDVLNTVLNFAFLWVIVLLWIGLFKVTGMSRGKAALLILLPLAIMIVIFILVSVGFFGGF